jgi:hypothetical protein
MWLALGETRLDLVTRESAKCAVEVAEARLACTLFQSIERRQSLVFEHSLIDPRREPAVCERLDEVLRRNVTLLQHLHHGTKAELEALVASLHVRTEVPELRHHALDRLHATREGLHVRGFVGPAEATGELE